jgi:hypothetical protein
VNKLVEPKDFVFDDIAEAAVAKAIADYPPGKQVSAVKALLDIAQRQVQRQTGSAWVPQAADTRLRKRNVLHDVQREAGWQISFAAVHHDSMLAAWLR